MSDLPFVRSRPLAHAAWRRPSWVVTLYAVAALAAGTGLVVATTAHPALPLEWQLALLLRFMAVVKAAMVLAALGLTQWRFRQPIDGAIAGGFVVSVALMLVAPGVIWSLTHVALGAGLFHAGLLLFLVLAWRDDAAGKFLSRRAARPDRRP